MKRFAALLFLVAVPALADPPPPAPAPAPGIPTANDAPPTDPIAPNDPTAPPETAPDPPPPIPPPVAAAKGTLILAPDLVGHFQIVDAVSGVFVAEVEKREGRALRFALPAGDYRLARSGDAASEAIIALTIDPGVELVVARVNFPADEIPVAVPPIEPPPPPQYPLTLAARPLTLPAHTLEIAGTYFGNFDSSNYGSEIALGPFSYGLTDRFSLRGLGVYYALIPKDGVPELAVGGGLSGISYADVTGLQLFFNFAVDGKLHFGQRVALAPRFLYTLGVQTTNALPLDHEIAAGIDLLIDVAARFSLIVSGDYDFHRTRTTEGVDGSPTFDTQRITPSLAVHFAAATWLDLRTGVGPSWLWADAVPLTLGGRWHFAARIRW